jgi:hypothetical protein
LCQMNRMYAGTEESVLQAPERRPAPAGIMDLE